MGVFIFCAKKRKSLLNYYITKTKKCQINVFYIEEEYVYFVAENPGVRMAEAHVRYITVVDESSGDRSYSCELNTQLVLTSGHVFTDEVEVDRHCEHLF